MTASIKSVLTCEEASRRSNWVQKIQYHLELDLTAGNDPSSILPQPQYDGKVTAQFEIPSTLSQDAKSSPLWLDFSNENSPAIKEIRLNQAALELKCWNPDRHRIELPWELLSASSVQHLEIRFSNGYTTKGKGFHRATDPIDREVYVYANLEPFFANELFPCFDQPDLKAEFSCAITVPTHWKVICNTLESQVKPASQDRSHVTWHFPLSRPMSTYLIQVAAGAYTEIHDQEPFHIPLRLFARKSLAPSVESETWFELTRHAFHFYEEAFGLYPFGKYDQILVPGTASGAMESVAAVTFNENFITQGAMTPSQKTALANTLIHELAHMWFGNWVTMKWWDDLWLNESFATFMSSLAQDELCKKGALSGLLDAWSWFYSRSKIAAYEADAYPTTHPIVVPVADTQEGFSNFDVITYEKGASVLKQLYNSLGKEVFLKGVRSYLETHAFGNATRTDFFSALSKASGKELAEWDEQWLRQSGTNSVELSSGAGSVWGSGTIWLTQSPDPITMTLRSHSAVLGLFVKTESQTGGSAEGPKVELAGSMPIEYTGGVTEILLPKKERNYEFVFPNLGDHDFALFSLDPIQFEFVEQNLGLFEDPLLKQQLLGCLWQMLRDGQLGAGKWSQIILRNLEQEPDPTVLSIVYSRLKYSLWYVPPLNRPAINEAHCEFLLKKLKNSAPASGEKELSFLALCGMDLPNPRHPWVELAISLLEGKPETHREYLDGIPLVQDRRWKLLISLARSGHPDALPLIHRELEQDKSTRGQMGAKTCRMAMPDLIAKLAGFEDLSTPLLIGAVDTLSLGNEFHSPLQEGLTAFAASQFLASIQTLSKADLERKVGRFIRTTYPHLYPDYFESDVKEFIAKNRPSPLVTRALIECMEDRKQENRAVRKFSQ